MTTSDTTHRPVFVAELISFIVKERSAVYCDSTCGYGHFAERLAKATGPQTRIFAIDIDPDAVNATRSRLAKFGKRCVVMRGSYVDLPELAAQTGVGLLNGVVIDGGLVSREQLLDPEKGLSFMVDGMLDMRIDPMQN
ncbi:MAG: 16S rRNA (cytosine(1402)-N(4))-methyltransferase, partial [Candidatus Zipacnadales bacterium]